MDLHKFDWEPKIRPGGNIQLLDGCTWQEEIDVSPDGESFAAVVALEDGTFSLRVNDGLWTSTAEKMCACRFAPDNRLTSIVQVDGEWALAVDDVIGEEHFDYLWGTMFSKRNGRIAVPFQRDMRYGVMLEDMLWENLYTSATNFTISDTGLYTSAIVQTKSLGQADLDGFGKKIFTVAVDGTPWEETYLNAWSPCFDADEHRAACTVRLTPYEYTIAVNGQCWDETFSCAWEPCFEPESGACIAPVRKGGAWGLAHNGSMIWKPTFSQCWSPVAVDKHIWAIAAPTYGAFTVVGDGQPWKCRFPSVTDLVVSPDGTRAAALGSQNNARFQVLVDGAPWSDVYDMAWAPVFDPQSRHLAVRVQRGAKYAMVVDGKTVADNLDQVWTPSFSPDGNVLLFCSVRDGVFYRHTVNVD